MNNKKEEERDRKETKREIRQSYLNNTYDPPKLTLTSSLLLV